MVTPKRAYFDWNSANPIKESAKKAILEITGLIGNPSSIHAEGRALRKVIDDARRDVASSIGNSDAARRCVFTSGGTESNQTVIRAVLEAKLLSRTAGDGELFWCGTEIEHSSILNLRKYFEARGVRFAPIRCLKTGVIDLEQLESTLKLRPALFSTHWVHNELGVIQDVSRIRALCKQYDVPLHLDAAQAWGKVPVLEKDFGPQEWVAFSGHKIGAPAGVGVVVMPPHENLTAPVRLLFGDHEGGRRGGTENALGIGALGAASREIDPSSFEATLRPLQREFEASLADPAHKIRVNSQAVNRVASTSHVTILENQLKKGVLVQYLDLAGFAVSSGSACASGAPRPSNALLAIGYTEEEAFSSIRISFGATTTSSMLMHLSNALKNLPGRRQTQ